MDFKTLATPAGGLAGVNADALLVVLAGGSAAAGLDAPLATAVEAAIKSGDFDAKAGATLYLHGLAGIKALRVVLAAAGDGSIKAIRKAVAAGLGAVKAGGSQHLAVAVVGAELTADHAAALVAAVAESLYVYRQTKPSAPAASRLQKISLVCAKDGAAALAEGLRLGEHLAAGTELARELANLPANHCTPRHLADTARRLGKEHGLKVEILERADCEKLGMGSFLAVAQGSAEAPKFIVARYQGAGKAEAPVVLVGKGITFDTGGISIKPSAEMDEMKFDMGGAASVLGTLRAVAGLKAKVNLVGIIPACENMPSSRAVKPGDVVTSLSGQTIEILNTDAEGRLILCDALSYAERLKPAVVVDIATLTGACVIALGHHRSGLFSGDDPLAAELLAAGEQALDPAWRMPLDEEYDEALKSNFADMGNVGPRAGGAITAAMFLKRFTAKLRWAHLDIAGTAWKSGAAKGATGRPVPLLTHFVLARAKRK
ncbi:aminopeptidase A, a cyteinylglycinase [Rubrivivax sp. A210]|uniref:leucyl aminopeptidase n=1 Tax=Rubrivivax sp. A210 TaxID=2772301 RepID=UPI0019196D05|nr:leucyl aminopeptidase [Rubrivivax sp. A210]CAD5373748.1 aminopeptidase A, a cyteinylglycinase [Rubrivivax sp. A210]